MEFLLGCLVFVTVLLAVDSAHAAGRPSYMIYRAGTPITVDGRLDEPAWVAAPDVGGVRLPLVHRRQTGADGGEDALGRYPSLRFIYLRRRPYLGRSHPSATARYAMTTAWKCLPRRIRKCRTFISMSR